MNNYVVVLDMCYGVEVYFVKAENEKEAEKILREDTYLIFHKIISIKPISSVLENMEDNSCQYIGGYVE